MAMKFIRCLQIFWEKILTHRDYDIVSDRLPIKSAKIKIKRLLARVQRPTSTTPNYPT